MPIFQDELRFARVQGEPRFFVMRLILWVRLSYSFIYRGIITMRGLVQHGVQWVEVNKGDF